MKDAYTGVYGQPKLYLVGWKNKKLHADYKAAIELSEMIVQIGVAYTVKIDREPHTRDTLTQVIV